MKKNTLILIFPIISVLLFSSLFVCAQAPLTEPPANINIPKVFDKIADLLISIATPIAVIMVIIAGFYFMTAQGDPGKIETAKKMFLWALIGMAVVLLAKQSISMVTSMIK